MSLPRSTIILGTGVVSLLLSAIVAIPSVSLCADSPAATQASPSTQPLAGIRLSLEFRNLDPNDVHNQMGAPLETKLSVENHSGSSLAIGLPVRVTVLAGQRSYQPGSVEAAWRGKPGLVILLNPPANDSIVGFHSKGSKGTKELRDGESWSMPVDLSETAQVKGDWSITIMLVQNGKPLARSEQIVLKVR